MRANKRPLVVTRESHAGASNFEVEVSLYRPSLWKREWNLKKVLRVVGDSRAELVVLPENSIGLIWKGGCSDGERPLDALNRLNAITPLYMEKLRDFLEGGEGEYGLEYLLSQVEILRERISLMEGIFEEFKTSLTDLSEKTGKVIVTILAEGRGEKIYSSLVIAIGRDLFVRRLSHGGLWSLIFDPGEEPRVVEIGSIEYLFCTVDEVAKHLKNGGEIGELNIVLGPPKDGLYVPGRCINVNTYPKEVMVSPLEGLYLSVSLDGSTVALGSSRRGRYLIDVENLSLDYFPIK
jgi:hypothetical protein